MNDATGLVAFKAALAAAAVGAFSLRAAALEFVLVACGGLAVGLAGAYGVGRLRDLLRRTRNSDAFIEITLSLLTPYAAYLAAEAIGVSSVLAVVAAGLYSGWRDPLRMDAESAPDRLDGLVRRPVLAQRARLPPARAAVPPAARGRARGIHGFPAADRRRDRHRRGGGGAHRLVLSRRLPALSPLAQSAPARGAALVAGRPRRRLGGHARAWSRWRRRSRFPLLRPAGPLPGRDLVIFLAFGVIAATLLLQGQRRNGSSASSSSGGPDPPAGGAVWPGRPRSTPGWRRCGPSRRNSGCRGTGRPGPRRRRIRTSPGIAGGGGRDADPREEAAGRGEALPAAALDAERAAVDDLWRRNVIADEVHRPLQQLLDYEESMLRIALPRRIRSGAWRARGRPPPGRAKKGERQVAIILLHDRNPGRSPIVDTARRAGTIVGMIRKLIDGAMRRSIQELITPQFEAIGLQFQAIGLRLDKMDARLRIPTPA